MPSDGRVRFGKIGEDLACDELRRRGYAVLERRYRTRAGEIDIVGRDGATIVFVEVKARATGDYGSGAEAITPAKQRRLSMMAAEYLHQRGSAGAPCRFDVAVVSLDASGRASVELIRSAFDFQHSRFSV